MAEVMAGFVCGYALALIAAPVLAIALVRNRAKNAYVSQVVPPGTNLVALSVVLFGFAFMALTAIGLVLGMMLAGVEDSRPASGLGSPNGSFTALVLAVVLVAVVPLAVVRASWRRPLIAFGVIFGVTFGWAMPWLSLAGPEG